LKTPPCLDQLLLQVLFAAAIGNVLSKNHDAFVALHLVAHAGMDEVSHGLLRALGLGLGGKARGCGSISDRVDKIAEEPRHEATGAARGRGLS